MAHAHEGRTVVSEPNNVGEQRMLGVIHDTGDIGIGEISTNGRYSAHLYATQVVRDHAERLLKLCDLAEDKITAEEAGFVDEQDGNDRDNDEEE
jgi:hypothetical protein